jgi:indolepyruvate ferredoxin oxidoreductase alpha subunit
MERTFDEEIGQLSLGQGAVVRSEGILAVAKALLQSGVSYVGGYQGSPVTQLLDVLVSAKPFMNRLGVHVESCSNEASAAAMLAASINYSVRGAVTWKSIVGTNVASDALSNLASAGVKGGALIILGEDYGEGASVIQERSLAVALKSSIWLVDPRPNLSSMVDLVEKSFALSEASNAPVMMQLRIRACHVQGEFIAKDNVSPAHGENAKFAEPAPFQYERLSHPPVTFLQERRKIEERLPAARKFIRENRLNEVFRGRHRELGLILQGGLYNTAMRQLAEMGLADEFGAPAVDILVLNVTNPLVPDEIEGFCRGKRAVLVVEEGSPAFLELEIVQMLSRADGAIRVSGKDVLPEAGEYTGAALARGILDFLEQHRPDGLDLAHARNYVDRLDRAAREGAAAFETGLPERPPSFCTGCPERPVFGAIKLVERDLGKLHIAGDIGCHAFATYPPFSMGNSILGYGLSLASMAAVSPIQERRGIAVMGDGGFWHNGLQTGVLGNLFNCGDGVLVIMQNGYASATGQQDLPSSPYMTIDTQPRRGIEIERVLKSLGVKWLRTVRTYSVARMKRALTDALTTAEKGLKVIIADGECMLVRQRREGAERARDLKAGRRVGEPRFGVDEDVCTGDHSCIDLSGCPSLTVKPNPDPLRSEPVAHVNQDCAACGLCGEMAHAARLCPSFYRAERIHNAGRFERFVHRARQAAIMSLARLAA